MVMNASGEARVQITEQDISARTPAGRGTYAGCVVPSRRGPVYPVLVTSPDSFNDYYTLRGKIEVADLLNMFAARDTVRKTNKVWMVRAVSPLALIGGADIYRANAATKVNAAFSRGYRDILNYDPTTADGYPVLAPSAAIFSDFNGDNVSVSGVLWDTIYTGSPIVFSGVADAVAPAGITYGTTYYAIVSSTPNIIKIATSQANAIAGTAVNFTDAGTGEHTANVQGREVLPANDERAITIFAKNPGDWVMLLTTLTYSLASATSSI